MSLLEFEWDVSFACFFFLMVLWGLGEEGKWAVIWDCPPAGSMCWHAWLLERSQATDPVLKTEKSFRF